MGRVALAWRGPAFSPPRLAFVVGLVVALGYASVTGHVWEDYLITFRHSKNLAEGRGLVFQPGERVHGFTSPLGVLLPAAFHFAVGSPESFLPALWCFRLLGAAAFAGGLAFFVRRLTRAGMAGWAFTAPLLLALEIKGASFSVNGQETGLMIFFLGWSVDLLSKPGPIRWKRLALAWAGLQWTRPDGVVIGGAWAVSRLVYASTEERRPLLGGYFKAIALALLVYCPWLVFTTLYYGSPIPQTVVAKSVAFESVPPTLGGWVNHVTSRMRYFIEPACFFFGGWPKWEWRFALTIALAGSVLWMLPGGSALSQFARRASFASVLLLAYFCKINIYAWYVPPAALLLLAGLAAAVVDRPLRTAIVVTLSYVAAVMVEESRLRVGHSSQNILLIAGVLMAALAWRAPRPALTTALVASGVIGLAAIFGMSTYQLAVQQATIENGCRTKIGLWLRDHVARDETVYVECLGYIGYFSNCRMLDYPGLASPRVAAANRRRSSPEEYSLQERLAALIPELKPDWLVLRDIERQAAEKLGVLADYRVRARFDVSQEIIDRHPNLPGLGYLLYDSRFTIFQLAPPVPEMRRRPPDS